MPMLEIAGSEISRADIEDLLETDHPMVERFQFVEQPVRDRASLSFSLIILPRRGVRYLQQRDRNGDRVQPAWKTLTGDERIGQGNRVIWREGDDLVAENSTFFPNQEFNDLGIGSALYVSMERLYRHLGIRRVSLLAVDVGTYVWARQGFAFADRGEVEDLLPLLRGLAAKHDERDSLSASRFQDSWDLANFDIEGVELDGYRIGKFFMLNHVVSWSGVKYLDDERNNAVAEASRRQTFARLPEKIEGASPDSKVR